MAPHITEKVRLRSTRRPTAVEKNEKISEAKNSASKLPTERVQLKTTPKINASAAKSPEPVTPAATPAAAAAMLENLFASASNSQSSANTSSPTSSSSSTERKTSTHAKVEVTSCFRSTGSMPIPKVSAEKSPVMAVTAQPSPPTLTLPVIQEADEVHIHELELSTGEIKGKNLPILPPVMAKLSVEGKLEQASVQGLVSVEECPKPEPPKPKPKKQQTCKKHSRCHCDLLGLQVDDFFSVVPQ